MEPVADRMMGNKGSAVWEAIPISALLVVITAALLAAGYRFFARAYLIYQSEQTLYCLAEGKSSVLCRRQLQERINRFLPWGRLSILALRQSTDSTEIAGRWSLSLGHGREIEVAIQRRLVFEQAKKASSSLAWPR